MIQNKKGFTLVELIVVITVLAVLATVWFISLTWYSQESRDAKRLADISTIHKWLQLYQTRYSTLPEPWESSLIVGSGSTQLFTQWYVTKEVVAPISVSEVIDPTGSWPYVYSVNSTKTKYQLWSFLENDSQLSKNVVSQAYMNYENRYIYSMWNKVWLLFDSVSNTPLQDIIENTLDLSTTNTVYKVVFSNTIEANIGWTDLFNEIIAQTNNSWKQSEIIQHTINFDQNWGTGWTEQIELEPNTLLPEIVVPTRETCLFQWYFSEENWQWTKYYDQAWNTTSSFEATSDLNLYAHYTCSSCTEPMRISKTTYGGWWPNAEIQAAIKALPAWTKICMKSSDNQWNGYAIEFTRNGSVANGNDWAQSPWRVLRLENGSVANTYNCSTNYCFRQVYGTNPWSHNNSYAWLFFGINSNLIWHPGCGQGPTFNSVWVPSYTWDCQQNVDFHW